MSEEHLDGFQVFTPTEEAITPQPYKRYCPKGHDTWVVGRSGGGHTCRTCQKQENAAKNERDKAARREQNKFEYVPGLRAYRYKCGYSLAELAWESGVPKDTIWRIEMEIQKASYSQRVDIRNAFILLQEKENEAARKLIEHKKRLIRAGIA